MQGRFPDGGATKVLVRELERRARGRRWPACEAEAKRPHMKFTKQFCGAVPVQAELRKYRARVRKQVQLAQSFWSSTTFVDDELQDEAAAAAAEAMRGSENARNAFSRVIVGLGFHLEQSTAGDEKTAVFTWIFGCTSGICPP